MRCAQLKVFFVKYFSLMLKNVVLFSIVFLCFDAQSSQSTQKAKAPRACIFLVRPLGAEDYYFINAAEEKLFGDAHNVDDACKLHFDLLVSAKENFFKESFVVTDSVKSADCK